MGICVSVERRRGPIKAKREIRGLVKVGAAVRWEQTYSNLSGSPRELRKLLQLLLLLQGTWCPSVSPADPRGTLTAAHRLWARGNHEVPALPHGMTRAERQGMKGPHP